jgi:eukaryotic-like serine/threonine-protein kinase
MPFEGVRVEQSVTGSPLSFLESAHGGRYAFRRELGRGGMATVYLAHDSVRDQLVAVKVLLPELAVNLGVDRFLREIEVGTILQHPHIVGVLDSGQVEGTLYYTMPFVEGASLRERLQREKQLPISDVITIAREVSEALDYAHSKGVIHRDIKPENILLSPDHGAMVADFGVARAVSVAGGDTITRTGMTVGTPTYMAPEQAMGSRDVTPESDIYSLGCVVYEMLAGQPPFTGPTAMAVFARHSLDQIPSLRIVRGTVPDAVEDAILQALAKVPADRFRSTRDFAAALTDDGAAASLAVLAVAGWFAWPHMHGNTAPAGLTGDFAKKNIAVMYFEDRSRGASLGYLADGLTEALIDELSAVPQLKVTSRNGSAAFKGKDAIPTDSIARALKVGTVVNGTVELADQGRVRVTVRLVDALSGAQIDKTVIEHPMQSELDLQDSVAHTVSLFLRKRLGQEVQELVSRVGTRNDAAWDALQRARQTETEVDALVRAHDVPAGVAKLAAADTALAAVETIDKSWPTPSVDRAWLGYRAARLVGPSDSSFTRWIDSGLADAARALAKAPGNVDATEARGTLHYLQWLYNLAPNAAAADALLASAEHDLRTVTRTNDQRASAWNTLSHLLINKGQLAEAKLAAENAYKADPYLTDVDKTILRLFLASLDLGLRGEAERWCTEGRTRFPQSYRFTECRLWLYSLPAPAPPNLADVWKTYDEYVTASPANVQEFDKLKGKMMVALALVRAGQMDSARSLARSAEGDPQIDPTGELTNLASIVFAQSGRKDAAIDLIARFLAANPQQRAFAAKDESWWLKDLRSDPRYVALLKGAK